MMNSPFACFTPDWLDDCDFIPGVVMSPETIARLRMREKIEKQIRAPYYRIDQWKSMPASNNFHCKSNNGILYDRNAGCLMAAKKRLVSVKFSNNVKLLTYHQSAHAGSVIVSNIAIKG
jgi:hypothetical protein